MHLILAHQAYNKLLEMKEQYTDSLKENRNDEEIVELTKAFLFDINELLKKFE